MAQKLFSQDEKYLTKGAGEDLGAYVFVIEDTDTADVVVAGAGENAIGVTDAAWEDGDAAVRVVYDGITYVYAAASLAVGALVASDASGKAVAYAVGDYCLGRAMSAGVSGSLMAIKLQSGSILDTDTDT